MESSRNRRVRVETREIREIEDLYFGFRELPFFLFIHFLKYSSKRATDKTYSQHKLYSTIFSLTNLTARQNIIAIIVNNKFSIIS